MEEIINEIIDEPIDLPPTEFIEIQPEESIELPPEEPISVLVKLNANNEIVAVDSSVFVNDLTNWAKIDEGYGDKFALAQSNYFNKPLRSRKGFYNYKYENGQIIEVDNTEKDTALTQKLNEIAQLKQNLANTDYQAIKYSEGFISDDDYAPIKAERQSWRDRINELEKGGSDE